MVVLSARFVKVKVVRGGSIRHGRRHVILTLIIFVISIVILAIMLVLHGLYSL